MQISGERCHLQDELPEANKGLMEETSCAHTQEDNKLRRRDDVLYFNSMYSQYTFSFLLFEDMFQF